MLSAATISQVTQAVVSSKLNAIVPDQKDQEQCIEPEVEQDDQKTEQASPSHVSKLSIRAEQIKLSLAPSNGSVVDAVVLTADGQAKQIKYDTTSSLKQANSILSGRPTIIGQLEGINVIVCRAVDSHGASNQNQLPYPLCNQASHNGDYLLFRSDANANPTNFSVQEYQKYVAGNQQETEQAIKSYNANEERAIHPSSIVQSECGYTLQSLQTELAIQFRAENSKASEEEVSKYVSSAVETLITQSLQNDTPLNDPDYHVEDDPDYQQQEPQQQQQDQEDDEEDIDESVWRASLDDALDGVREQGRAAGQQLAAQISDTFTELNGNEPSFNDLSNIFELIQGKFQEEASEQINEDEDEEDDVDETEWRAQLDEALNFVRAKGRFDGQQLAEQISETFYELNGDEPSVRDLNRIFGQIQEELEESAGEEYDQESGDEEDEEVWRDQLDDALEGVREQGRAAGQQLAENIAETYFEINGNEASVHDLNSIFAQIQDHLQEEAEEDQEAEPEEEEDDGTAYSTAQTIDTVDAADPADLVEYATRIVGENIVAQIAASYSITKRREPSAEELREAVLQATDQLAEQIIEQFESNEQESSEEDEEEEQDEEDSDYDPQNEEDQDQADEDEEDEEDFEDDTQNEEISIESNYSAPEQMQASSSTMSKLGQAESYSVHFGEFSSSQQEKKMISAAVRSFKMRNSRSPNAFELNHISQFVKSENV